MMPAIYPIQIYQGDRKELILRVRDQVLDVDGITWIPGAYVDLTGKTVKAQLRLTAADVTIAAEFTCTLADQVTLPGQVSCVLTPVQTKVLTAPSYVYDVEITTSATDIETYLAGPVTVIPEVTRA